MSYIVKSSQAKMPTAVKARYMRVAVLQVEPGTTSVTMISGRARGVIRVVETWERLHAVGKNTAYARALSKARSLADRLNRGSA